MKFCASLRENSALVYSGGYLVNYHRFDERNGFYYSVDLLSIDDIYLIHIGLPRYLNTLIKKIDVWSGFLAMSASISTPKQAEQSFTQE